MLRGNGLFIETDRLFVDGNYQWTERISVGARAVVFWTFEVGSMNGRRSYPSSKYFQTGYSVRWRTAEQSTARLGYQFFWRKSRSTKAAFGKAVSLFFTQPIGRMAISR